MKTDPRESILPPSLGDEKKHLLPSENRPVASGAPITKYPQDQKEWDPSRIDRYSSYSSGNESGKSSDKNPDDPHGAGYLFKYIILAQVFVYLEAGAVPALLGQFTETFDLNPQTQGLLGAVVYISISLASPLCAYLFRHYSARLILGLSLVVNALSVLLFALTPVGYTYSTTCLILSRALIGFTQAFLSVYSPLWIHEYAPKSKRAISMSYLQASIPVGVTVGYLVGSIAIWCSEKASGCYLFLCWRYPFLFAFVFVAPLALLTFWIPERHIVSRRLVTRKSMMLIDEEEDEQPYLPSSSSNPGLPIIVLRGQHESEWEGLSHLLHTPVFVCVVLGLSCLFFVVTGIQYWVTLFLTTNTQDSAYVIHLAYLFVSGTGPILGVFFGGWLVDSQGGYSGEHNQARTLKFCTYLGIVAALAAIPPSFLSSAYLIAVFLWIMLFCGGAILPGCSGIVIASVPQSLRPMASSVASTSYNLLGYAASNYIPGLIMSFISHDACGPACLYRVGFRIVVAWSGVSLLFIALAAYYAAKQAHTQAVGHK